jgi:putative membrane protein
MKDTRRFLWLAAAASLALAAPAFGAEDAEFVKQAASGGMLEVELGRHVATNAADADVRAFGVRMAADHGAANRELAVVARGSGLALPTEMAPKHREMAEQLTALRGADLDRAYMDAMVKDHEQDVKAFEEQAEQGKTEVDRWAARTLPTLQAHLTHAQTLAERIEAASTSREDYETPGSGLPAGPDTGRTPDRP